MLFRFLHFVIFAVRDLSPNETKISFVFPMEMEKKRENIFILSWTVSFNDRKTTRQLILSICAMKNSGSELKIDAKSIHRVEPETDQNDGTMPLMDQTERVLSS